jgi:hypothetical protein
MYSGYRTSSRARKLLILGTASAIACGVSVLCIVVNDAGTWQATQPGGWLPLLFIPAIVLVALAFGIVWGLGAGLTASGLTLLSAIIDGGAPFGTEGTVNLFGFIVVPTFLAAGWCYGTDTVRNRPRWQVVLSVPLFPIAMLVALVWLVSSAPPFGGGSGSGNAQRPYQPEAMLVYDQSPLARLDQLPADPEDYAWTYQVLRDGLEQGDVDPVDLGRAIDTALDHHWSLRQMTLLLHLTTETQLRLAAGFAAIACGLAPDRGVFLVQAGQATKELAERLADILLEYQRLSAGVAEPDVDPPVSGWSTRSAAKPGPASIPST